MTVVTGLGQCSYDYIAAVDSFAEEDSKKEISAWHESGGGPVATALVSLSRLGIETTFMGRVSDDRAGRLIRKELREEGINTRGLRSLPGGKSQTAFIVANKTNAKRTIFWQQATVRPLAPKEISKKQIQRSDLLLIDGLMREASLHAAAIAREASVPVMIDAGSLRDHTVELLKLSDYIVCSENFSREFAVTPRETVKELLKFMPRAITITLGDKGSISCFNGEIFKSPAFKVKAVDTTGAGDVFHGGYIYGILQGWPIEKTVEFASAFAALKCQKPGGRSGIPTLEKTLSFMKGR